MSQTHPPSEELFAYRDGELDPERRSLIEAHVLSCSACAARVETLSDAEGVLRQETPEPDADYYDRMTESVMGRVAKEAGGSNAARAAAGTGAGAGPPPRAERAARSGRRRNFEDEPRGRAPGLPWPAILSTVSAAAAVVVVGILIVQRQDAWRRAPAPGILGETRAEAPAAESKKDVGVAPEEGAPAAGAPEAMADRGVADQVAPSAPSRQEVAANLAPPAGGEAPAIREDRPVPPALRQSEVKTQSADEALPDLAAQKVALGKTEERARALGRAEAIAGARVETSQPSSAAVPEPSAGYADVLARYGLPSLYDPARVRGDALLRAEPDIRYLYQTGGAGADSARARLYLAEAARLRAGDTIDADTFDTIVHHYRRALQMARDPETARVVRQRFEDFVSRSAPSR